MKRLMLLGLMASLTGVGSVTAEEELQVFFGLLHGHTSFSDGVGQPADAYRSARAAGLDYFAVTEHNHSQAGGDDGIFLTPALYGQLRLAAEQNTDDGFVALFGQEVSSISRGNHVNVFNANTIVDIENGDFRDLYERFLPEHPEIPFIQFNHPNFRRDQDPNERPSRRNNDYGIDDYNQSFPALVEASRNQVQLIELIIGPGFSQSLDKDHHDGRDEDDYLFYLNQGFKIGPSVGQDNHRQNWGLSTHARLGTWAFSLTTDGIYEALSARRTFASEDENVEVGFRLNDRWMGDTVGVVAGDTANIEVSISDPNEPAASYTVFLFYDDAVGQGPARVIQGRSIVGDNGNVTFTHTPDVGGYYFVKLTQSSDDELDDDDVWTSPIWIASGEVDQDPDDEHGDVAEIHWTEAEDFIGLERKVTGRIVGTFNAGSVLFLNFDSNFRETLSLVVFDDDYEEFGGAAALQQRVEGQEVQVQGEITTFRGRLQVILRNPDQILSVSED